MTTSFPYLSFARDTDIPYSIILRLADRLKVFRIEDSELAPGMTRLHLEALERVVADEERRRRMVIFGLRNHIEFNDVEIAASHLGMGIFPSDSPLRRMTYSQRWQLMNCSHRLKPDEFVERGRAFDEVFGEDQDHACP